MMDQANFDGLRKLCEANEPGRCVSMSVLRQLIELVDHLESIAKKDSAGRPAEAQQVSPETGALQARIDELVEQLEAERKKARELQIKIHELNRDRNVAARRLIEEALDAL